MTTSWHQRLNLDSFWCFVSAPRWTCDVCYIYICWMCMLHLSSWIIISFSTLLINVYEISTPMIMKNLFSAHLGRQIWSLSSVSSFGCLLNKLFLLDSFSGTGFAVHQAEGLGLGYRANGLICICVEGVQTMTEESQLGMTVWFRCYIYGCQALTTFSLLLFLNLSELIWGWGKDGI